MAPRLPAIQASWLQLHLVCLFVSPASFFGGFPFASQELGVLRCIEPLCSTSRTESSCIGKIRDALSLEPTVVLTQPLRSQVRGDCHTSRMGTPELHLFKCALCSRTVWLLCVDIEGQGLGQSFLGQGRKEVWEGA